jgi:hypothetical protein
MQRVKGPDDEIYRLAVEIHEEIGRPLFAFHRIEDTLRKRLVPLGHSLPIEGELKLTNPKGFNP